MNSRNLSLILIQIISKVISLFIILYSSLFIFKGIYDISLTSYINFLFNLFFIILGFLGLFVATNLTTKKQFTTKNKQILLLWLLGVALSIASLLLNWSNLATTILNFGLFASTSLVNFIAIFVRLHFGLKDFFVLAFIFNLLAQAYWLFFLASFIKGLFKKITQKYASK